MMSQLVAGEVNSVSYSEIIPNLDLGRAGDTKNADYRLVVCAMNSARQLHDSLKAPGLERVQLPIIVNGEDVSADASSHADKDVGLESFEFDGQRPLCQALSRIDQVLRKGGKVFVCCQHGKDCSALVVLAYLRARFSVPRERVANLYNYVQSKRFIVSLRENPQHWHFITDKFNVVLAQQMMGARRD